MWPLPNDAFSHLRSAGTFSRFLAHYVRERHTISLPDAIEKTTYLTTAATGTSGASTDFASAHPEDRAIAPSSRHFWMS